MKPMTHISDGLGDATRTGAIIGLSRAPLSRGDGLSRAPLSRGDGLGDATGTGVRAGLSQAQLSRIVACTAAQSGRWRDLVRYDLARRWYHRLELSDVYEVWLLSWQPGQGTGYHDHGGSRGAFAVAFGELQEQTVHARATVAVRSVSAGGVRSFGPWFVHQVVNNSAGPAVSVHAYSPPLPDMGRYELTPAGLRHVRTEPAGVSA